jgi:uncharacterized small protein (DUF1192 family)
VNDVIRFLATWALMHETADEEWKAAVARGRGPDDTAAGGGLADGIAALVAEEKERLKAELTAKGGVRAAGAAPPDLRELLDGLRFELAELRGRIESLQASVDALGARRREPA